MASAALDSEAHARSSWATYLTEWDQLRYPGGVLSVLTFLQVLVLTRSGTVFSVLVLSSSIPVMLYSARRILFTVVLAVAFAGLYIAYWVVTRHYHGVLFEERFMVALNMLALAGCLTSSALFPHQYGSNERPEHWRFERDQLHCAMPIFSGRDYGRGESAPLSQA